MCKTRLNIQMSVHLCGFKAYKWILEGNNHVCEDLMIPVSGLSAKWLLMTGVYPYLRYSFSELVIVFMSQSSFADRSTSLAFSSEWITYFQQHIILLENSQTHLRTFINSKQLKCDYFMSRLESPNTQYKYVCNEPCGNKNSASGLAG